MRQIASGGENGNFEIAFELTEAAEFLNWCRGSLLAPDKQCRLAKAPEGVANVDVEVTRQERRRRVASAALM